MSVFQQIVVPRSDNYPQHYVTVPTPQLLAAFGVLLTPPLLTVVFVTPTWEESTLREVKERVDRNFSNTQITFHWTLGQGIFARSDSAPSTHPRRLSKGYSCIVLQQLRNTLGSSPIVEIHAVDAYGNSNGVPIRKVALPRGVPEYKAVFPFNFATARVFKQGEDPFTLSRWSSATVGSAITEVTSAQKLKWEDEAGNPRTPDSFLTALARLGEAPMMGSRPPAASPGEKGKGG